VYQFTSGVARGGGQVGAPPKRRSWERINTLFQPFKHVFLSRNLDQNVPKNVYFLEKSCKNCRSVNPRWLPDPALQLSPTVTGLQHRVRFCVSSAKRVLLRSEKDRCNISRYSSFVFVPLFHFRLCSFVDVGAKIFFASGRRVS